MTIMCIQCLDNPASIKFCSKSCAATYNNKRRVRSVESRDKTSQSMRGVPSPFKGKEKVTRVTLPCYICGTSVRVFKKTEHKNHTCGSNECKTAAKSIAGRVSANKRVKRSADEIKLFELCTSQFTNVVSNYVISDGWDADIVLLDFKTAILWNGPWHYKEMGLKNHSLKQVQTRDKIKTKLFKDLGWNVYIFEDRYYTPEQAFVVVRAGTAPT